MENNPEIDFDYQILHLTNNFYNNYPNPPYKEILRKMDRPYNCLLIQSHYDDYFICIPYRTEISHGYSYKFTSSQRSRAHKSGLDYTKIVIVSNKDYIEASDALVDNDEYLETIQNIKRIVRESNDFVEEYVKHCNGENVLHQREYNRRYKYSPLKYFHNELKINNQESTTYPESATTPQQEVAATTEQATTEQATTDHLSSNQD